MIALHDFNRLPEKESLALLHPCVAIPGWAEALVRGRPYSRREDVFSTALALTQRWDETALTQALSAHPRIGEKPAGSQAEAALSRQEQGAVNDRDAALTQALREETPAMKPVSDGSFLSARRAAAEKRSYRR